MRIFVLEYTTGGGLLLAAGAAVESQQPSPRRLDSSLLREGTAMVAALAGDFAALPDCEVHILRDGDVELPLPAGVCAHIVQSAADYRAALDEQATAATWTVVIAPEYGGALLDCAERVLSSGGRLLSPGPRIVRLTSDKHATAEHLERAGVPVPRGALVGSRNSIPANLTFPLVIKPRDGAGSQGVRLLRSPEDFQGAIESIDSPNGQAKLRARVEAYCPGEAVSVAFLCGPNGNVALPACRQRLSQDGRFRYLGGSTPLEPALAARAVGLASRAVESLALLSGSSQLASCPHPGPLPRGEGEFDGVVGYLGVDLVLGADPAGGDDRVIEINPRLTTSYVGLRAALSGNLAAAMLDVAQGRAPTLGVCSEVASTHVEWEAGLTIQRSSRGT